MASSVVVLIVIVLASCTAWKVPTPRMVRTAVLASCTAWKVPTPRMVRTAVQKTIASVGLATLIGSGTAIADAIPLLGTPAPAFNLPSNIPGKDLSLSDLKGKWTVLYFYPGDFTQSCTIEAQAFERDLPLYKKLGVGIIGVSVDSAEKHLDFAKTYNLEFPLASDAGGVVSAKYGSLLDLGFLGRYSNRQTYIINPEGKVDWVFTKVEDRIAKHSTEVLAKLEELLGKA